MFFDSNLVRNYLDPRWDVLSVDGNGTTTMTINLSFGLPAKRFNLLIPEYQSFIFDSEGNPSNKVELIFFAIRRNQPSESRTFQTTNLLGNPVTDRKYYTIMGIPVDGMLLREGKVYIEQVIYEDGTQESRKMVKGRK